VRHIRPHVRRLLVARVVLHPARRHARCRRQVHTNAPTQFTLTIVAQSQVPFISSLLKTRNDNEEVRREKRKNEGREGRERKEEEEKIKNVKRMN